ncbi:hypothetical protein DFH28DRAFT_891249, partial [Melampsora americana]
ASITCEACPSSRSMKVQSLNKHKQSAEHIERYAIWLSKQKTASVPISNSRKNDIDELDSSSQEDQVSVYIGDMSDVEKDEDLEERRRELIDLWTKDHTAIFNTPVPSLNSSEGHSVAPSVHSSEDEINDDYAEDGDQSDSNDRYHCQADIDKDDSSWAPFSSLEACLHFCKSDSLLY